MKSLIESLLALFPNTVFKTFPILAAGAFAIVGAIFMLGHPGGAGLKVALLVLGVIAFALSVVKIKRHLKKNREEGQAYENSLK